MTDHDSPAAPDAAPPATAAPGAPLPDVPAPAATGPSDTPSPSGSAPAAPLPDEERAARRTRRRRAAVRWCAAAAVCALAGTGSTLAVTASDRTDLPGLATESDGRYTFPPLALPPLPSGKAAPKENKSRHAADLRYLLLPVPAEAGGPLTPAAFPPPTLPGTGAAAPSTGPTASTTVFGSPAPAAAATGAGWTACNDMAAEQKDPAKLRAVLTQYACQAATVREWTTSDGTRTQIRLLSFGSSHEAWSVYAALRDGDDPKDLAGLGKLAPQGWDEVYGITLATRATRTADTSTPPPARLAHLAAGDLVGVITMTNPTGVPAAAFQQVVTLQSDLLA
ncbi:hypothetical protein [Kitasatospora purpeofusca]|uniref:hypothetical protein n=1 Tax=Kitasatospora purpeofusca TaxID=67352 RepID=UPI003863BC44|nr:hypothetical protein OIP63_38900 [Kitasatospora purpeofusca]